MNWRQFLKPDWRKSLFSVFTFLLLIFLSFSCSVYETQGLPESNPGWHYPCGSFSSIQTDFIISLEKLLGDALGFLFGVFGINLVISYLISCLIIWIYNKVKKR